MNQSFKLAHLRSRHICDHDINIVLCLVCTKLEVYTGLIIFSSRHLRSRNSHRTSLWTISTECVSSLFARGTGSQEWRHALFIDPIHATSPTTWVKFITTFLVKLQHNKCLQHEQSCWGTFNVRAEFTFLMLVYFPSDQTKDSWRSLVMHYYLVFSNAMTDF